jgi:hypothetical protein
MRSDARHISWYTRISWDCIHFEAPTAVQQIDEAIRDTGFRKYQIDGSTIGTTRQMVITVAGAMGFPTFVSNLDGLIEYLRTAAFDFSSDETQVTGRAPGLLLIVRNATDWLSQDPHSAGELISVWLVAAEDMSEEGIAAHMVFEIQ